ncbi:uncharacterized protein N7484_006507 [Penicillium longicatenatum]|uniref:uncharacterized protein n=1 Tax=Penicillium longicatenatum TaxID=1561947 RepID=UPI00254739BE|nr:uncharacterized protein N7484_006507 [Penicillium longicatenatum]KAJ5644000.1 hypothetical protein N7484_006507 [Penicillium longicatenatum]
MYFLAATPKNLQRKARTTIFKASQGPVSDMDWLAAFLECVTEDGRKDVLVYTYEGCPQHLFFAMSLSNFIQHYINIGKAASILKVKHATPGSKDGDEVNDEEDEELSSVQQ